MRVKWCGATSQVTWTPRLLPCRTASSVVHALMWAMCSRPPTISATRMSRPAVIASAMPGMPFRPSDAATGPSWATPSPFKRRVLAVLDQRHVEHAGVLHRPAGQQRRRHRMAVVADRDAAGLLQLGDVGELLAQLAARHRANRIDPGQAGIGRLAQDEVGDPGVVVDRPGVGHAGDGGEPAGHRRRGAGRHRLLVLLPGLAQVHVHVDEPRADDQVGRQRRPPRRRRRGSPADRARPWR